MTGTATAPDRTGDTRREPAAPPETDGEQRPPEKYLTVWVSDLHLGTPGANAAAFLEFLKTFECEKLYLVGDIVDLWSLRRNPHWRQEFNDVIQKLLRCARKGTQIIYIAGNHDEFLVNVVGQYGNIRVATSDIHVTDCGRRLLVMHGHELDGVIHHLPWLAHLGDMAYTGLLVVNRHLNRVRMWLGYDYWSFSAFIKTRVKHAVAFVSRFEQGIAKFAELHHADGVVCGHTHTPGARTIRSVTYYNAGDWVESNSALVEHEGGRMELLQLRCRPLPRDVRRSEPLSTATANTNPT